MSNTLLIMSMTGLSVMNLFMLIGLIAIRIEMGKIHTQVNSRLTDTTSRLETAIECLATAKADLASAYEEIRKLNSQNSE